MAKEKRNELKSFFSIKAKVERVKRRVRGLRWGKERGDYFLNAIDFFSTAHANALAIALAKHKKKVNPFLILAFFSLRH